MEPSDGKIKIVNELHRGARKNFIRRHTIIKGYKDLWQIDLAEVQQYADENDGYRYILVCINCYSKYVYTRAIKNKTGIEVTNAMKSIIKEASYTPNNLQSDQGKEFYNSLFQALIKKYNINHYSTYSTKKAAIVERVIRTLKIKLYKQFSARGTYKWLKILPIITSSYNNTKHRTIAMKPVDVKEDTKINAYDYLKIIPRKRKFRLGDIVRISKYKTVFEKGYTASWSTELFKIVKANATNPPTYLLESIEGEPIKGCFYEAELQKTTSPNVYLVEKIVKRRKKNNIDQIFVKWLGFPNQFNSWINKSDIV
jgi:hypothetical protein